MKKPLVSVIIPHFNRTRLLAETLASVQKQTLKDWEVIVVDDVSDKAEWNRLQEFREEKITILQRENQPKGPSACRNIGIRAARGEFVVFLDSDDLLAPWCLETRVSDFRENPGLDFLVYPSLLFEHTPGDLNRLWNYTDEKSDQLERFLYSDIPWCVTGPVWKRETLIHLGGFKEELVYGDDSELHIRALLSHCSFKIFNNQLPDNFIRRSDEKRTTSGLSRQVKRYRLNYLESVGQLLMNKNGETGYLEIWDGEYFAELESYVLNNQLDSIKPIVYLLNLRVSGKITKLTINYYVFLSSLLAKRYFILFKMVRRLLLLFLPQAFSSRPKTFCKLTLPLSVFSELNMKLKG